MFTQIVRKLWSQKSIFLQYFIAGDVYIDVCSDIFVNVIYMCLCMIHIGEYTDATGWVLCGDIADEARMASFRCVLFMIKLLHKCFELLCSLLMP
jgi:hypothetical protein